MSLARKIVQLRKEKEWTQAQLARAMGNQRYISLWETGKNVPELDNLIKLSQVFDASLDYLVFNNVPRSGTSTISDFELYEHFRLAENLPEEDRNAIKMAVSALAFRHKVRTARAEIDQVNEPKPVKKIRKKTN